MIFWSRSSFYFRSLIFQMVLSCYCYLKLHNSPIHLLPYCNKYFVYFFSVYCKILQSRNPSRKSNNHNRINFDYIHLSLNREHMLELKQEKLVQFPHIITKLLSRQADFNLSRTLNPYWCLLELISTANFHRLQISFNFKFVMTIYLFVL